MSKDKRALRRALRERSVALTPEYRESADAKIRQAVLGYEPWQRAQTVFVFVSMGSEPDTRALLEDALASGKALYVPLCREEHTMEAVRVLSLAELKPGTFGIPEPPENGERLGEEEIDLALVPCVSATRDGRRLGHGGGYYDRFLARHPCPTLCLCYEALLSAELPTDAYDVKMDAVATEKGIFSNISGKPVQ